MIDAVHCAVLRELPCHIVFFRVVVVTGNPEIVFLEFGSFEQRFVDGVAGVDDRAASVVFFDDFQPYQRSSAQLFLAMKERSDLKVEHRA